MIENQLVAVRHLERLAAKGHEPPRGREAGPDSLGVRVAEPPGRREGGCGHWTDSTCHAECKMQNAKCRSRGDILHFAFDVMKKWAPLLVLSLELAIIIIDTTLLNVSLSTLVR